jgi:Ca2+-binding EF-hand superfamily protein/ribosomal protein S12
MQSKEDLDNDLHDAFMMMADGSGHVTKRSIGQFLEGFGKSFTDEELEYVVDRLGGFAHEASNNDQNRALDESTFKEIIEARLRVAHESRDAFTHVFDLFNVSSTGTLSVAELRDAMQRLGEPVTHEEARAMIATAGHRGDFVQLMTAQNDSAFFPGGQQSRGGPPDDPNAEECTVRKVKGKGKKKKRKKKKSASLAAASASMSRYATMVKMKVPEASIRKQMEINGVSSQEIEAFFRPKDEAEDENEDKFRKYKQLRKMSVPDARIRQQMEINGVPKAEIDAFFES